MPKISRTTPRMHPSTKYLLWGIILGLAALAYLVLTEVTETGGIPFLGSFLIGFSIFFILRSVRLEEREKAERRIEQYRQNWRQSVADAQARALREASHWVINLTHTEKPYGYDYRTSVHIAAEIRSRATDLQRKAMNQENDSEYDKDGVTL